MSIETESQVSALDPRQLTEEALSKQVVAFLKAQEKTEQATKETLDLAKGRVNRPLDPAKMAEWASRERVYATEGRVHLVFEEARWKIKIEGEVVGSFGSPSDAATAFGMATGRKILGEDGTPYLAGEYVVGWIHDGCPPPRRIVYLGLADGSTWKGTLLPPDGEDDEWGWKLTEPFRDGDLAFPLAVVAWSPSLQPGPPPDSLPAMNLPPECFYRVAGKMTWAIVDSTKESYYSHKGTGDAVEPENIRTVELDASLLLRGLLGPDEGGGS